MLKDDVFLVAPTPAPKAPERKFNFADRSLLSGIGDPGIREAQRELRTSEFLLGASVATPSWSNEAGTYILGDAVEFTHPTGGHVVTGELANVVGDQAVVATAQAEMLSVPLPIIRAERPRTRRERKRASLTHTVNPLNVVSEIELNASGDLEVLVTRLGQDVREDAVHALIASRYPERRLLDVAFAGRQARIVLAQALPQVSPKVPLHDNPEGAGLTQEFTDDEASRWEPSIATGALLERFAAANPGLRFNVTSIEQSEAHIAHFQVSAASGERMWLTPQGTLTNVLAADVTPAQGRVINGRLVMLGAREVTAGPLDLHNPVTSPGLEVDAAPKWDLSNVRHDQYEEEKRRYEDSQQEQEAEEARRKMRRLKRQTPVAPKTTHIDEPISDQPDWLETAPLHMQSSDDEDAEADADREHLGGPGIQLASEVDDESKEYWEEYYDDGYGTAMTEDVPQKPKTKAAAPKRARRETLVVQAFNEAKRPLRATELFDVLRVLAQQAAPGAGGLSGLAQSLDQARKSGAPAASNAVDKLVVDYLARSPEALEGLGAYSTLLNQAVDYWERMQPKRLEKLRSKYAPEQPAVGTAHEPNLMTKMRETLDPKQRIQREFDTQMGTEPAPAPAPAPAPSTPATPATTPADDNAPLDLADYGFSMDDAPSSGPAPEDEPIDLADYGFSMDDEPATPAAPAAPAAPAEPATPAAPAEPAAPKKRTRPAAQFQPTPDMRVIDSRGQQVPAPASGKVVKKWPDGTVRYRTPEGVFTAFPPEAQAPSPVAPTHTVQPGMRQRLIDRLRGASAKEAYKALGPAHTADDPTPGTYKERKGVPPAARDMHFRLSNLHAEGGYLVGDVAWDADETKDMTAKSVEMAVQGFILKLVSNRGASQDLGHVAGVTVVELDAEAGLASVRFRSTNAKAFPQAVIVKE